MDGNPYPCSVDGSVPSPSPRLSAGLLFVLESTPEGEEWTEAEVMASLECSEELSVSFIGSTPTVKDWSNLWTPFVNVLVTCVLFVWVTEELWREVELLRLFFILPEEAGWSEEGGPLWVQENGSPECSWPDEVLFRENTVGSLGSRA